MTRWFLYPEYDNNEINTESDHFILIQCTLNLCFLLIQATTASVIFTELEYTLLPTHQQQI